MFISHISFSHALPALKCSADAEMTTNIASCRTAGLLAQFLPSSVPVTVPGCAGSPFPLDQTHPTLDFPQNPAVTAQTVSLFTSVPLEEPRIFCSFAPRSPGNCLWCYFPISVSAGSIPGVGTYSFLRKAQWPIGYGVGLRIKRSSIRIRPWAGGRCVGSLDKALYSHCPKEKPSH